MNLFSRLALALTFCATAACGSQEVTSAPEKVVVVPGLTYVVTTDPNLTEVQVLQVNAALGQWEAATPGLHFTVYEGPVSSEPHTIHVQNETDAVINAHEVGCLGWTSQDLTNDRAIVHLDVDKPAGQWISAHELGHAMGLQHNPEHGTLMCVNEGCSVPQVTPADVTALLNRQ